MTKMREDGHEPATKADLRGILSRLDGHDQRLDGHDRRLDSIDENLRRLNVGFARMEGDIVELKGTVKVLLQDFSRFSIILERVSSNVENFLRKMDMQGSMLMEHEGRIKKLESRPN